MMTDMLSDVIDHGTARAARGMFKGTGGRGQDRHFARWLVRRLHAESRLRRVDRLRRREQLSLRGPIPRCPLGPSSFAARSSLRPELGGKEFARPASIATVDIDPETGMIAAASCPQRETVSIAPAFVPNHECSLHGDPWGVRALALAIADDAETESAQAAQVTRTPELAEGARASASSNVYAATGAPLIEASSKQIPLRDAGRATEVIVGRDGRPRLTNEMQVAPKGSNNWQD